MSSPIPMCKGLIDQNLHCGTDPVGHCCTNQALVRVETGHELIMCGKCYETIFIKWDRKHALESITFLFEKDSVMYTRGSCDHYRKEMREIYNREGLYGASPPLPKTQRI